MGGMRIVAVPSGGQVLRRSVLYGGGLGAAAGVLVLLVYPPLLLLSPLAAGIGFMAGVWCGLPAGLVLAAVRKSIAGRQAAIRLTAGSAAAVIPAALLVAVAGHRDHRGALGAACLLAVSFALAFLCGPIAFYGRTRSRQPRVRISTRLDPQQEVPKAARHELADGSP